MLDKVKVGGSEYQINIKEHLEAYDGDRNLWGCCNYEQSEIDILKSLSSQRANTCHIVRSGLYRPRRGNG